MIFLFSWNLGHCISRWWISLAACRSHNSRVRMLATVPLNDGLSHFSLLALHTILTTFSHILIILWSTSARCHHKRYLVSSNTSCKMLLSLCNIVVVFQYMSSLCQAFSQHILDQSTFLYIGVFPLITFCTTSISRKPKRSRVKNIKKGTPVSA